MAIRSIAQLKAWFQRGKYPTAEQFGDWLDSFLHKEDTISIDTVENLPKILNDKYGAAEGLVLEEQTKQAQELATEVKGDLINAFASIAELEAEDEQIRTDFTAADAAEKTAREGGDAATLTSAKSYTDGKAADLAAEDTKIRGEFAAADAQIREEYAAADAAEKIAREGGDAATLTSAKNHTTERESVLRAEQIAADAATLENANGYTDGQETSIRRDFAASDAAHEAIVRSDMATGDQSTLQEAKEHTAMREAAIRLDMATADAATRTSSKTYTDSKVAELVNGSPEALDTLRELSTALGDDPNFATTIATQIGGKVDKVAGKGLSTEDFTSEAKSKLAGIAAGANNYTHPASHSASMIEQDGTHRFVSDAERETWNNKPGSATATPTTTGMMSASDKSKLDSVAAGANNYTHPATHSAAMIEQDDTHRFATDAEKTAWNGKADGNHNHDGAYVPISASCNRSWRWEGRPGTPAWVWGGIDPAEHFAYNPREFHVSSADTCGDADTLDGIQAAGFARAYSGYMTFGGSSADITTAEFVTMLVDFGAFNQPYWVGRGSWDWGTNKTIADTGVGRIHLAGAVVEVIGTTTSYTIRITTSPETWGEMRRVFIYIHNAADYDPVWFKLANAEIATTTKEGLLSAADKLKIDNLPTNAMSSLTPAAVASSPLTVVGGRAYYFTGTGSISVTGIDKFTNQNDCAMLTVPGNVIVNFGSAFKSLKDLITISGTASQYKTYTIQRVPVATNVFVYEVNGAIYG